MNKKNFQKAFTLLEILVVISIMGILIALGTAAFSTAQKKGRDARRREDLKSVQAAMEQYYSNYSGYPNGSSLDILYNQDNGFDSTYLPAGVPEDPKNRDDYVYTMISNGDAYCTCALMESGGGNASEEATGNPCNFGEGDYYCLTSLQ